MEMRAKSERTGRIRIERPETGTLVAVVAIAGGTIAAGLILYYLRKRKRRGRMDHY
jgi:LPXTG-motif cell wall-anchored protein